MLLLLVKMMTTEVTMTVRSPAIAGCCGSCRCGGRSCNSGGRGCMVVAVLVLVVLVMSASSC